MFSYKFLLENYGLENLGLPKSPNLHRQSLRKLKTSQPLDWKVICLLNCEGFNSPKLLQELQDAQLSYDLKFTAGFHV
ncbi:hypothetical protein [Streptococcus sobrinus]|uniref:Uncharacterized protein n=2 Tax=Streptococcus sobrinus TaxID=1310 RepID=U2J251_9STRE|nr:hypothetical protein [Streptococcus sobrinus]AWN61604.1 hypothetical protein DLJ52_05045 [Streptococcus sobrinus]AWN63476.1 hypothetical protein DLJ51_05045 [Streptococcus sobrinus]ERJ73835.1 hypothetical protein HMPREF1557_02057 [Streptococcus sobrinus W1703]OZV23637.1 hypothetical protein RO09_03990 [Streptococcus sobrinus]